MSAFFTGCPPGGSEYYFLKREPFLKTAVLVYRDMKLQRMQQNSLKARLGFSRFLLPPQPSLVFFIKNTHLWAISLSLLALPICKKTRKSEHLLKMQVEVNRRASTGLGISHILPFSPP